MALFIALLLLVSSCSLAGKAGTSASSSKSSKSSKSVENVRTGTEGISVSFLPNNPPATIVVESGLTTPVKVVLQLINKGAYPQPDEAVGGLAPAFGRVYLSGYDRKIIEFTQKLFELNQKALEGKSPINPNGGIDFVTFDGNIFAENLNVERYEPTLLATACYYYYTKAGPQVCIDPDPYSTITQKKVCQVGDITLTNQGAPIAVTKITEEALATKTQFRITVKNVGNGEVIKWSEAAGSVDKCNPWGTEKLGREDIDKVYLQRVTIGSKALECGPFADQSTKGVQGFIRLINGEGSIICELPKQEYGSTNSAYTTPLEIWVSYVYKTHAERKVLIKREIGMVIGGGSSPTTSQSTTQGIGA